MQWWVDTWDILLIIELRNDTMILEEIKKPDWKYLYGCMVQDGEVTGQKKQQGKYLSLL